MSVVNRYAGRGEAALASDAIAVWEGGASNPRAVSRVLVDMIDWYVDRGGSAEPRSKAPIELVQGHLLYLLDMGLGAVPVGSSDEAQTACHDLVAAAKRTQATEPECRDCGNTTPDWEGSACTCW